MSEPKFAVIVEGGELTDAARDDLRNKLEELADPNKVRSAIILETGSMGAYANENVSIDLVRLS